LQPISPLARLAERIADHPAPRGAIVITRRCRCR
jgi:hypothetical protein